ncbi:MAG: N4-gp56 family major capsid protein [Clostridia bacterium]|nr:N4-gp56 family major capsid protein [Clostridia bacterium]
MAINYASKYAQKIDEKFARESMTSPAVNNDYDFVGVKTVNVYSVPTAPMNDYSVTGTSRYGTPEELDNTVQELTMSMDRSFTFTIDRGTYNDTQMSNAAGAALQRQLREVVVPEIDKYRFGKIVEGAGTTVTGTISKTTAYDAFLTGASELIENNVPLTGCTAFVSSNFYKNIKEDSSFIRNGDMSQDILIKGQVGTIDGIPVIVVPKSYFPEGVEFIITNQAATTAPVKLSEYKIHDNPPGINGWLVEGRVYYDAFVLDNKKDAIYVFKNAAAASTGE